MTLKKKVTIVTLANTSNDFLKYLDKSGLNLGDVIEISDIESFDKSLTVLHKKNYITLSNEAAKNMLVTSPQTPLQRRGAK